MLPETTMSMIAAIEPMRAETLYLQVRQIRREAVDINSYELVDPEGAELPAAAAGSHVDIHLGNGLIRQYSLCNDPADRGRYVIAVLREDAGRGGSRQLHESLRVRDRVEIGRPRNNFSLDPAAGRLHRSYRPLARWNRSQRVLHAEDVGPRRAGRNCGYFYGCNRQHRGAHQRRAGLQHRRCAQCERHSGAHLLCVRALRHLQASLPMR
jgi:hypothetical protein